MKKEGPVIEILPEEMPEFLNKLAVECFKDNPEIYWKLAQCSFWMQLCNERDKK